MKSEEYWYGLFNRRASRRDFLRVSGNVGGLILLGTLPTSLAWSAQQFTSNPFALGLASGDPTPDGVVLWTRLDRETLRSAGVTDQPIATAWEIARDESFRRIVQTGSVAWAVPELGHSVHVEVEGLRSGQNILVSV